MVELGLNSHHQALVLSYMKFARYLRGQSIKAVEDDFKNASAALFDDTFTQEEVRKIIDDLKTIVSCDVEGEVCSFTHNNVLMLQQLFTQAESWHLRMEIQLSELQNRDLLEMIRQLEAGESELKPAKEKDTGESAVVLLRMEIERLRGENELLQSQQRECADKLDDTQHKLTTATGKLTEASEQIKAFSAIAPTVNKPEIDTAKVAEMSEKLQRVQELLHTDKENSRQRHATLVNELNSTREQVAQVRSQLKLTELELERKFSETKAYANMKQILVKKNSQIKELRSKVQQLGGQPDDSSDE